MKLKDIQNSDYDDLTWLALDLRDKAYECLGSTIFGKPSNKYLYYTEPIADCCDSVIVWLREFRPVQQFPNENFQIIKSCRDVRYMPIWVISIFRNCAPTLTNRVNPFPTPAEINDYSIGIYDDVRTIQCCILGSLMEGDEYGGVQYKEGASVNFLPKNIEIYDLGTCTRIDFPILFDMPECCDGDDDA